MSAFAMTPTAYQEEVSQLATRYEQAYFKHYPEMGMFWGRADVAQDKFTDHSLNALLTWQKTEDEFLKALNAIPVKPLEGSAAFITYQLLKQSLENNKAARVCKDELWDVNPLHGWHNILTMIAEKQPVGTPENRQNALKRWQGVEQIVNDEITNLKIGLQQGYIAPKPAVTRVLRQLAILLDTPVEKSPFFDFALRDGDAHFKSEMMKVIHHQIYPAMKRYADFLEKDYLSKARTDIAVSALPGNIACYQSKIQKETTLTISPQAIYDFGLEHMEQLKKEVATIGQREFGTSDIATIFRLAKEDPRNRFNTEDEILAYNQAALKKAYDKAGMWFDLVPKSAATLKPYPLHRAITGAAGEYHPPSEDGQRPGIFYINTYEPHKKCRLDHEATLFHELIPGHHFQVALSIEDSSHHSLDKFLWNAGFGEGWALYTERLADEMGLYQDDMSRLGMLSNEALRTARLVVDPGIHAMNWTREQAIDYLKQHTALEEHIIEAEVDRYIMLPGQATSYMLGKREIESLRTLAKKQLGKRFDIREYHNQVLKQGAVTLPMLQAQIKGWLAAYQN
ncbi:DUF885 domain-containing protein [Candidatus Berkiella aquae]|uniref:DUF885 domain-containing protein n=1 Tax=Candidatus Berkiella aquae TaxID=295108 RepID=UPI001F40D9F7|nr:DUF885 domain-containing protein [Candidatus Berkiella aquae]